MLKKKVINVKIKVYFCNNMVFESFINNKHKEPIKGKTSTSNNNQELSNKKLYIIYYKKK